MSDFTRAAAAADVPAGEARVVEVDGRSIALCHVDGDAIDYDHYIGDVVILERFHGGGVTLFSQRIEGARAISRSIHSRIGVRVV